MLIKFNKICCSFNKIILILLFIFIPLSCFAKPLFITEDNIWDENTKIYVANCDKGRKGDQNKEGNKENDKIKQNEINQYSYQDKIVYLPDFLDIIFVKLNQNPYIFAVTAGNEQKASILYCFNLVEHQQNTVYVFPRGFNKAYLNTAKVNISGNQKQYLSVIANGDYANLFDITHPEAVIKPVNEFGFQGNLKQINAGQFIKMKQTHVFILGGLDTMGTLYLVDLSNPARILSFRTHKKNAIISFKALDTTQSGVADQLLLCDAANHLWRFNMNDTREGFQLLSTKMQASDFIAAKNLKQPGISLYYLDKGLLNSLNISTVTGIENQPQVLKNAGENFHSIFIRSDRLILVPKLISSKQLPIIFDLPTEKPIRTSWVFLLNSGVANINAAETNDTLNEIIQSKLLWDPKSQQEHLMTINQKGDINILSAPITRDKLGRQVWRSC